MTSQGISWPVSQRGQWNLRRHVSHSLLHNKPFPSLELLQQWQHPKPKQKVYQVQCVQFSERKEGRMNE